tara:strand:+ start:408 stop:3524 length:3117 start_codon:yes stop_codon:yes gene_type:complete
MSLKWNGSGAVNVTGSVFTTCTANLSFTDDNVRAVYIDWDDGTNPQGVRSNEKEYANYQWQQITKPTGALSIEHTYTGTGTFAPVIQVLNSEGIVSAYYGSDTTNTDVSPYYDNPTHQTFEAIDGVATGITNIENKRVLSGIDNSIFNTEGPQRLYMMIPPLVSGSELANIGDIDIEITVVVDASSILSGASTTDDADLTSVAAGSGESVQVITGSRTSAQVTGGTSLYEIPLGGGLVSQVLKVKWLNPKFAATSSQRYDTYAVNNAYKNVKIFIVTEGNKQLASVSQYYPVTYVSAGSPIKTVNDSRRYINADFSQSRAKASNVTNLQYRYDVGKSFFNPANAWATSSGYGSPKKFFDNRTVLSGNSNKQISYAYSSVRADGLNGRAWIDLTSTPSRAFASDANADWVLNDDQIYRTNQFLVDEFGRFNDQYHLVRNSMQPSSQTSYPPSSSSSSTVSSLIDNKPFVFRITPVVTTGSTDSMTKVDMTSLTNVYTADETEAAFRNTATHLVSLSGMNAAAFTDMSGNPRKDNEYLLMLFPKKTNKLFFNISNYAKNLIRSNLSGASFDTPWKISGLSYLTVDDVGSPTQNAYWKTVPFEDTTKVSMEYRDTGSKKYIEQSNSLSQSGYLSYDMPLDWDSVSLDNLCGGQSYTTTQTSGSFDLLLTGTVAAAADTDAIIDNYLKFTLDAASEALMNTTFLGTPSQKSTRVGAFRYIAFVQNTGSSSATDSLNKPMWCARSGESGDTSGWDAGSIMHFAIGDASTNYNVENLVGNTGVVLLLRRINVYDVVTGVSKVGLNPTGGTSKVPVDATRAAGFPQTYFLSGSGFSTVGVAMNDAWKDENLYALKISLSGTVGTHTFPSVWNVFDATESHVEVVTEIDDTAYNLNSVPMTSDISITRAGTYFTAITRRGKVYISRTGDQIQQIGFSSVALGNERNSEAFVKSGPGTLYGNLHTIRKLQQNNVRVYWDEIQKDGTFVRFWGVVINIQENHQKNGPQAIKSFNCQMTVSEIALIDGNSKLMTDIFPLGGIESVPDYT